MFPVGEFKSARIADIAGGSLVLCKWDTKFRLALAVILPAPQGPGLLLLEGERQPTFVTPTGYCLDLGKPIVQSSLTADSIADATQRAPASGYLIAHPGGILIMGIGIRSMMQTRCTWDLDTGELRDVPLESVVYLTKWLLGKRDASGQYQTLFAFESPQRVA